MKQGHVTLGMSVGLAVATLCQVGYAQDADELKMLANHATMQEMAERMGLQGVEGVRLRGRMYRTRWENELSRIQRLSV